MKSLITKGPRKGRVTDLVHVKSCLYTDDVNDYVLSEFVQLETLESELETKKCEIASLQSEIDVMEKWLCENHSV